MPDRPAPPRRVEPPRGVQPLDVGTLRRGSPRTRDVGVWLVQLAVDGHLRVSPTRVQKGWGPTRDEVRSWRLERTQADEGALDPASRELLGVIFFGRKGVTTLSESRSAISDVSSDLARATHARAVENGWIRPDRLRTVFRVLMGVGFVAFLATIIVAGTGVARGATGPLAALGAVAGLGGWLCFAAGLVGSGINGKWGPRLRRTDEARRLTEQIDGFADYLAAGDDTRLRRADGAAVFSRYLPWAVATGTAKRWGDTFGSAAMGLATGDAADLRGWAQQLAWYPPLGGAVTSGGPVGPSPSPNGAWREEPLLDLTNGIGDAVADLGSGLSDFASDIADSASDVGDLASDFGSAGSDSGGGDLGGGSGGDSGGDSGSGS